MFTTYISAQNGKNGNGTLSFTEQIVDNTFEISIMCDGVEVDVLNFPVSFELRIRLHFKDGEIVWEKYQLNNALYTSMKTGEVFKAQDFEYANQKGMFVWNLHLIGNMGNKYNIKMVFDTSTWDLVEYKAVCH
jgi:hypothetical protein